MQSPPDAERYALALEFDQRESLRLGHRERHRLFRAWPVQDPRPQSRAHAPAERLDRPCPSRRPAAVQVHARRTPEGQDAALHDGAALPRRFRQLALGAAGRHRAAPARRLRLPHGGRGRRHHRYQASRRSAGRLRRRAQGDEPRDLRIADRARRRRAGGGAALRSGRRADLPPGGRPLSSRRGERSEPEAKGFSARREDPSHAQDHGRPHGDRAARHPRPRHHRRHRIQLARGSPGRGLPHHRRRAAVARR